LSEARETVGEVDDPGDLLRDEPVAVEVTDSALVYAGRVWDVRSDTVRYGDEEIVRQYVDHPGAAAVVALDDAGRVLLIQQYRHPVRLRDWEIPAGLLDVPGEDPIEAARRELAEEADLDAGSLEPLISIFTTPGGNDEVVHIFLARDLSPRGEAHAREAEEADIRAEWLPLEDAVAAVLAGRMRNGILAAGVFATTERLRRSVSAAPAEHG
jgi:ADP-ribose pyrophosphatase